MSNLKIGKIISHYMNYSQCHPTLGHPNPTSPPERSEAFQRTKSRFAFIARLQACQKYELPMVNLKPSMTNRFVLGKQRRSLDYLAQLGRSFGGEQDKKPELLQYLGKDLRCCAVCGQEEEQQINGICPCCYKKIQGALHNFKKQQLKEAVKGAYRCASNCNCARKRQKEEQYDKELENQRKIKEQRREEKQRELDEKLEQAKGNGKGTQPFNIIVLQDCNNSLINQLTAALAVSCTAEKATRQQQQQKSNPNSPPNDNTDNYNGNQINDNINDGYYSSGRNGNNSGNNFYTYQSNNNTPNNNDTPNNNHTPYNSANSNNSGPSYNNNNWRYVNNNQGNYNNNDGGYNSNNNPGNYSSVSGNCNNSMGNSMVGSQYNDNNYVRVPEDKNKPPSLNCTCNCAACRLGYENTLKLPMLLAQALEIFVMHNSPESKKEAKAKATTDSGSSKGSKNSIGSKASPKSLKDKSKGREGNKEANAAPMVRRATKQRKNKQDNTDTTTDKISKKARKATPEQEETSTTERGKVKARKSNISFEPSANSVENKSSNKSGGRGQTKPRNNAGSQGNGGSKPKTPERFRANAARAKQRSRGQKKLPEGKKSESMFFLPESDGTQCQHCPDSCSTACRAPCSTQNVNKCACCTNCRCTAGFQGKLVSCPYPLATTKSGAGDQSNRLNYPRPFINFNGCLGCSNCGAYSRPPPPREQMHPVAHFRPGVNLYPANLIINRSGDSVRQSVVRTAAGVTLHAVRRQEQEGHEESNKPFVNPRFPCGRNNQFWRRQL